MIAPLVGLSSVYAVSVGHGVSGAAAFWLALIGGGFALSFPIGRLSDRIERRLVLAGICFAALAAALVFRVVGDGSLEVLMIFGAVFRRPRLRRFTRLRRRIPTTTCRPRTACRRQPGC